MSVRASASTPCAFAPWPSRICRRVSVIFVSSRSGTTATPRNIGAVRHWHSTRDRWMRRAATLLIGWLALAGCAKTTTVRLGLPELRTVPRVDLQQYVGTWYGIASFPQRFQRGCTTHSGPNSVPQTGVHERYQFVPMTGEATFVLSIFQAVRCANPALQRTHWAVNLAPIEEGCFGSRIPL